MRRRYLLTAVLLLACGLAVREGGLGAQSGSEVREPALAGQFYPAGRAEIEAAIAAYVEDALPPAGERPIAMVVPHAGWIYSGQIAADAWRQAAAHHYDTIVLLGTNHASAGLAKAAVYPGTGMRTPLGVAPVDRLLVSALLADHDCVGDAAPHAREHSIEVHLPFVQRLFPKATIVAIVVPALDEGLPERLGRTLGRLLAERRALVVASSDLSHYPAARDAYEIDRRTLEAMASLDVRRFRSLVRGGIARGVPGLATCACGDAPVVAAMTAASAMGATRSRVVSYANSGDLPVGDAEKVVGYGAVVFSTGERGADTSALVRPAPAPPGPLGASDRAALLGLARRTITRYLQSGTLPLGRASSPGVEREQGVFVTLRKRGELRGCIGQMTPDGPLRRIVGAMALAAAFQDRRFPQVRAAELKDIEVEISLLTPFREVPAASAIVPGRDGVTLSKGDKSAVFLPQVATEQGWGRTELLDNLCAKAGLERGCWQRGARLSTFQAEVFSESEPRR